jgi:hypothetical protein
MDISPSHTKLQQSIDQSFNTGSELYCFHKPSFSRLLSISLRSILGENMPQLPNADGTYPPCDFTACTLEETWLGYVPNLGGNAFFIGLFGLAVLVQLGLGIRYKTWGFLVGMFGGLTLEVLGYIGRVKLHFEPFTRDWFLL